MSPRGRLLLWSLIGVGLVARTVVAFKTYGFTYDMDSLYAVRAALGDDVTNAYSTVNSGLYNRWPYMSGYFPFVTGSGKVADLTGLPFHGTIQLAPIAADAAIAWLVQDHLGRRGAGERVRLVAVGLVALGPSFWAISGFHGQLDSVAMLPAVLALWFWERSPPGVRRALIAGALIGLGVSIKTIPGLMLLALLPSVRSVREAAALVVPAALLPLVLLAPWLIADPNGTVDALRTHRALVGFGGISLLAQPGLADPWLSQEPLELSSLSEFLADKEFILTALLMAPLMALVLVRRTPPTQAAALLFCALPLFNIGFSFQYVVWALPLALMAGYLWQVAAVQAALLLPTIMFEWHPFDPPPSTLYVVLMIGTWAAATVGVIKLAVRLYRDRPTPGRAEPLPSPT
jgi:uncharacterized membrane protein